MDRRVRYDWPGNVCELMNAVERAVVLARTEYLDEADFPMLREQQPEAATLPAEALTPVLEGNLPLEEVENATFLKTLEAASGNKSEAARQLGITRKFCLYLMFVATSRGLIQNVGRKG